MPIAPTFPGVYIQEVPSGVHTITGVSTSIAAFIGRATKGKMNKATRILSLADFVRTFGDPHPMSDLANSVRLFFANGGTDCYVIRIAQGARAASVTLRSLDNKDVLLATAKAEGGWGDTVRMEVDYNTASPDDTFNLRVIFEDKGVPVATESFPNLSMNPGSPRFAPSFVSQSSELIDLKPTVAFTTEAGDITKSIAGFSLGRRPLGGTGAQVQTFLDARVNAAVPANIKSQFEISVNGSPFQTVQLRPWSPISTTVGGGAGSIEAELKTRIEAALSGLSPAPTVEISLATVGTMGRLLRITALNGDRSSVRIRRAASNDISAELMLGVDNGGLEATRWSNFRPAPTGAHLNLGAFTPGAGTNPGTNDLAALNAITDLEQDDITAVSIDGVNIPLNAAPNNIQTTAAGDRWFKSAAGDDDGVREKLNIIARAINAAPGLPWRAEVGGYHLNILARGGPINQLPTIAFTGTAAAAVLALFTRNVRQYTLGTGGTGTFSVLGVGGLDGTAPLPGDYLGNPVTQTGFHALDPVDIFNLLVIPADQEVPEADQTNLWGPASSYCAEHRAFLLIDPPNSWTAQPSPTNPVPRPAIVQNTTKVDTDIRSKVVKQNSAVFYPRLVFSDNGLIKKIGPAGAIAGLMARIDSSRGVWKAPAGTEADLRGIVGLEVNLTDPENGVLNKIGVNCERQFPSGLVNWGARTLDGHDDFGSEWKYIPIRRLALFLEESLFRGTKWIVFEPNDEPLWSKIRLNINAFMMSLFRQGAFQGSTPDKAFFVKCDAETTTQNDRNLGIVNIEVGFAPLKPAEFVIIKIQQIAGEL